MLELLILMLERMGVIVTIAFVLTRFSFFRKGIEHKPNPFSRIKLAVIFGLFGIVGTYAGVVVTPGDLNQRWFSSVSVEEAIANSRVIGVVMAGLLGGPFAGLTAGIIAGAHRVFLGGFTAWSCGLSTVVEGVLAGWVFKRFGKEKLVKTRDAFLTGWVAETLQMLIILFLSRPFEKAWGLVQVIGMPMIVTNSIGIAIFMAIIQSVYKEEEKAGAVQAQTTLKIANRTLQDW